MSLDGFIAAAGHVMDWGAGRQLADFVSPDEFHEIAAATGAMLVGRRTADVGARMQAEKPGSVDYPFSGPMFVLTHRPPEPPNPGITYLTGDIGEAVATARSAAGGKNVEILGADVAARACSGACRRDPGVRTAGTARRRRPLLAAEPTPDRPGTSQRHAVAQRHHPPVPRPQVSSERNRKTGGATVRVPQ
jgi:dihydrofolate reductase